MATIISDKSEVVEMKKYFWIAIFVCCFIGMAINIEWGKDSIKAFVTGGVLTWMAMRFCKV